VVQEVEAALDRIQAAGDPRVQRHLEGLLAAVPQEQRAPLEKALESVGLVVGGADFDRDELDDRVRQLRNVVEAAELLVLDDDVIASCAAAVARVDRVMAAGVGSRPRRSPGSVSTRQQRETILRSIEAALAATPGGSARLARVPGRDQTYLTQGGQRIHVRTRSFDPAKPPFFSMEPSNLIDGDWIVFGAEQRGCVVMPISKMRELSSGIYLDQRGSYKPTFIIDEAQCSIYHDGEHVDVSDHLNDFEAIAAAEPGLAAS
jgi:hypothetical protein